MGFWDTIGLGLCALIVVVFGGYILAFIGFIVLMILAFIIIVYEGIVNTITTICKEAIK